MAIWGTVLRLGAALGGFLMGALADVIGMRAVIVVAAASALLSVLRWSGA